jgi:hypothetical protein
LGFFSWSFFLDKYMIWKTIIASVKMILYRTLNKLRCLQVVFVQYQDDEVIMSLTDKTSFELSD